jgi:hypothetical protein
MEKDITRAFGAHWYLQKISRLTQIPATVEARIVGPDLFITH